MSAPANTNLAEILDALSEGVAVFDDGKHLVMANERYRSLDPQSAEGRLILTKELRTPSGNVIDLRTDVTEIRRRDRAFAILLEKGSIGNNFMETAVEALAVGLGYNWAGIGRFVNHHRGVQLEAYWNVDHIDKPFAYDLQGTPCDQVLENAGFCYYPTNIDLLFPEDLTFVEMKIKAYQGTVVFGIDGKPLGHIFAFHDEPDATSDGQRDFLRVIADWISLEFRRRHAEEQREIAERELRQHQKMEAIGRLAGGIAHEINTPIQYIGDNLRFMKEADEALTQFLKKTQEIYLHMESSENAEEKAKQLKKLAQELDLDYLKEECPRAIEQSLNGVEQVRVIVSAMKEFSHPPTSKKTPVDVNRVLANASEICRGEWRYIAELIPEIDEGLHPIWGLPTDLGQVFLNMMVNAAHAIKEKGVEPGLITIRTRNVENGVEIDIEDNGVGIPEENIEKIFEPFFTTKKLGEGTGQGLALAHDMIERKHKGQIHVRSKVGEGSCFTIFLPLGEDS